MKVSRPHKALPQIPQAKEQTPNASSTSPSESPPQTIASVPSTEGTPVGSPSSVTNIPTPTTAKWRAVKVQTMDQTVTRAGLATSNDSNSSANGSEPSNANNTPPTNEDKDKDKRITVIIIKWKIFDTK